MKQFIKRIFQTFLGISLLLLISGFVVTYFFSEKVENKVVSKIQEQMTSELQLGEVAFSLYEKFPSASVKITNLLAFEKEGFDNDTLFYAKETYIELSIFDIILNKIDIKTVVVSEGEINIKYDYENSPNFAIFKTNEESKNQLTLDNVLLLNTDINCQTKSIAINLHTTQAMLVFKEEKLALNAKLFSEILKVNSRDYIHKKNVKLLATLSLKKDSIFIQEGSIVHIEDVKAELSGGIFHSNTVDLNFSCEQQELVAVIEHTPEYLKSIYSSFQANGKISCNGNIKGLVSNESNPSLNMSCYIEKGNLNLKSRPFILKGVSLSGKITNGDEQNFRTTNIEITQFDAKTENGFLKGNFTIQNLNKYYLTANLSSSWDLAEINHYFEDSPFFNLQGNLIANTQYSGYISFDKKFKNHFLRAQHTSSTTFENASFSYKNFPLGFNFQSANCVFRNANVVEVKSSAFTIADSDLNFDGDITDLIAYILNKKDEIDVTGDLNSTYIKFDELLTLKDLSEGKGTGTMPTWINANLNTNITTFSYDDFIASEITGTLAYKNMTLTGENMLLNSLNGNIAGNFKFYESANNKLKLFSQLNLTRLNIRNAFLAFDNFKQDFITAKHIKGVGTAEIQMQSSWKPGFIFEEEELKVKSHLIIEKGELIHFKPLESLSDYVSLDDLKEVKFSTLENTIEIDNKVITIPTMEIKSSALSVFVSGTHTFEQEINYRIKLLLSELMSTKFRKKNTRIKKTEFGEVEENGKIFNTIYFKMTGNSEDPNISFDGIRFREDVQKGITKEKETITNIIKEEILLNKEKEKVEQGQDVIIEWDDE
ncbi:MAG: AsmA-like C-terminal region-containing protein [Flavobacteriales bacterium]|nr:AsmA-like C-terminal region-containing protein [Flavobacteriales bacterium]